MRLGVALTTALVLLAGCGSAQQDPVAEAGGVDPLPPGPGMLRGVVVDEAIRPLANASVTLSAVTNATWTAVTDAIGEFVFTGLEPTAYVVEVTARGFFPARTTATVLSGAETPEAVRIVLATDQATSPYVTVVKDEGFFEACAMYCSSYIDLLVDGNLCNPTGVCPGHLFADSGVSYHPNVDLPLPGWIQTEVVWTSTMPESPDLMVGHYYHTDGGPPTWGHFGPQQQRNEAVGPSPLVVATPPEMVQAEAIQDPPDSSLGFNKDRWGLALFVYPSGPQGNALALQQSYEAITHYFYNCQPQPGWRFTADGEPRPARWP